MASTKSKKTRKGLAVGLAVLGVAGLSFASASSLNVGQGQLQAGVNNLAGCQTGTVNVQFGEPTLSSAGTYKTDKVTLSGITPACVTAAAKVKVAVLKADGTVLRASDGVTAAASTTITVGDFEASDAIKVAVTIYL